MSVKGCLKFLGVLILFAFAASLLPKTEKDYLSDVNEALRIGDLEIAKASIDKVLVKDSLNPNYYEIRGKIMYRLGDIAQSQKNFDKVLLLADNDQKDMFVERMVDWHLRQGKKNDAKNYIEVKLEQHKGDSIGIIRATEYAVSKYFEMGDTALAINSYLELDKLAPNTGIYFNRIGTLYLVQGSKWKAVEYFKKAIRRERLNDSYLYNLGSAYLSLDHKRTAKRHFKEAMDLGNKKACHQYREMTVRVRYRRKSRCCDGTTSYALGRGACSHHGGVCGTVKEPYREYTVSCY